MPSEPHSRRETSKPATFLITLPPKCSSSPSAHSSTAPSTKSRAAPALDAPRPRQSRSDDAADGRVAAEGRRLERQDTAVLRQQASTSDSGVPQRAVITSSEGS